MGSLMGDCGGATDTAGGLARGRLVGPFDAALGKRCAGGAEAWGGDAGDAVSTRGRAKLGDSDDAGGSSAMGSGIPDRAAGVRTDVSQAPLPPATNRLATARSAQ